MKRILSILLFNLAVAVTAVAQCTVKGVLFDESNGEAIPFANVVLDGTTHGCATDINGFFLINKVPEEISPTIVPATAIFTIVRSPHV